MVIRPTDLMRRIEGMSVTHVPVTWFLDVDGVLNVIGKRPAGPADWLRFERGPVMNSDGRAWPFTWSPDLMACINLLVERKIVVVRWLTTWEWDAPRYVAPALGLDVGQWVGGADDDPWASTWWKLRAVETFMDDELGPFIWTDDDINGDLKARQFVDFLPIERGLAIAPESSRGLTPAHMEQIITLLEVWSASTSSG